MITSLNILDNATLWVAISFVIFVFLVFKPLKNMMLTSLDKKIAELKHQLEESKKLKEDADRLFTEQKKKYEEWKHLDELCRENRDCSEWGLFQYLFKKKEQFLLLHKKKFN